MIADFSDESLIVENWSLVATYTHCIKCVNLLDVMSSLGGKSESSLKNPHHRRASQVQGVWQTVYYFRQDDGDIFTTLSFSAI